MVLTMTKNWVMAEWLKKKYFGKSEIHLRNNDFAKVQKTLSLWFIETEVKQLVTASAFASFIKSVAWMHFRKFLFLSVISISESVISKVRHDFFLH